MRRQEREVKDSLVLEDIIKKSMVCRVAFHGDEFPYVLPMNFGYKDNALYFHCAKEGKKIDLIRQNNKVAFEITQDSKLVTGEASCQWTTEYRSVFGTGIVEILTDNEEKIKGLDVLMQHHGKMDNSYVPKLLDRLTVLKLNISSWSGKQAGEW